MNSLSILNMLQISDSLFPIGAFTLSNGLETFVQEGKVKTSLDLEQYIKNYLKILPYNDLGVMLLAFKNADDVKKIIEIDNIYAASKGPMEIRIGSEKLCNRFIKVWEKIRPVQKLEIYSEMIKSGDCYGHHPIAVGLFAFETGIDIIEAASIYTYSILSSIVTNAVKTVPLSQHDGQRLLNESLKLIMSLVESADSVSIDDLGIGGTEFEIAAMNHETLYSRLYMS